MPVINDNLQTARPRNLRLLERDERFEFIEADIVNPLPLDVLERTWSIGGVYNLARATSKKLFVLARFDAALSLRGHGPSGIRQRWPILRRNEAMPRSSPRKSVS